MLRVVLNSCCQIPRSSYHVGPLLKFTVPKLTQSSSLRTAHIIGRNACRTSQPQKNLVGLLFGGSGVTLALLVKSRNIFAKCDTDRLSAISAIDVNAKNLKFDWKRFGKYLSPHILKLLGAILAAIAVAYFNIRIPNLLGALVNALSKYVGTRSDDSIGSSSFFVVMKRPAFDLCMMYLLQSSFTFIYIFLLGQIGESMAANIRQDLFKQIVIQDLSFFDANRTGELVNRLTADVQDFKSSFKQCVSQGLRSVVQLFGGAVSLFLISPHLAAIALVAVPAAVVAGSFLGSALRGLSKRSQAQMERATAVCEEAISNIRTVRSSASEYLEIEIFKRETDNAAELAIELSNGIAVFHAMTNFLLNGMVLTTLYLGGHLMSTNSLTPGQLMAFLVASQGVQRSLSQGSILLGTLIRGMTAGTRVFEYLSTEPKVDLHKGVHIPAEYFKGQIVFHDVTFTYPSRPQQVVLKNFNLTLKPGQTVALVGTSGSGKSTIAGLLERFYEPSSGRITIDGYDLKDISPHWLRGQAIGFIEQQPILFGTSILENIRYGQPQATVSEIMEASKLAQSHEFIENLSENYQTNVGERGIQLSGGQRQRIAIARALLKQPKILILDEATSALDSTSEALVQRALDTAVLNRTTLVIAHRLSTIQNADLIVVLSQGSIVEMGTHSELMRQKSVYFNLVRQQEKEQIADNPKRAQG